MSNLIGAICALSMAVLIPSITYIQFVNNQTKMENNIDFKYNRFKYYMAHILIIVGIFIGISNVYELFHYGKNGPS